MGFIYQAKRDLAHDYLEETISWPKALIEPGKADSSVKVGPLSAAEAELILLKLDQLCLSRNHEGVAVMVAEEADSIITLVRMVKAETKSPFAGILGVGTQLDIVWLRPKDVGSTTLLNKDATSLCGLYGGTNAAVYTWLATVTANTQKDILPEQTTPEEAGVIHLGASDPIEVPKYSDILFTLAGIPCPRQSLKFSIREGFGTADLPFARFEKPVLIGPEKKQKVSLMPNITGDTKFELLSFLVARAQDLTL